MNAVRLGEHAKLIRGITFKPADKCDPQDEGAVVCMRTKNVQATLDESDLIAIPSNLVKNPEKMVSIGDVLVSSANSSNLVGKCCQVRGLQYPSTAGGFISILRPTTEKLDSGYLYRWFSSEKIQRRVRSFGNQTTNISNLDHKRTLKLPIPLPPLAEQKRIAGVLDAADALRFKRRESLAQLDTLLQSTFLDMFGDPVIDPTGWEVRQLADVFWLQEGPGVRKWQFKGSGIKLLNVSNILKSGDLDLSKTDRHLSTDEVQQKYSHFLVDAGDLVIASSGISIDEDDLLRTRGAFVGDEHLPLCMNTSTIRFKATDGVSDLRFLQQWLQSREFRTQITQEVTGSAQKNFGPTHLKRIRITLPPPERQRRFAVIVESVEQQKASQRSHLDELDTLFASLQSRAFRGDL